MSVQTGNISVQAENIFPIIKKFLYSDHDIFLRELVSNAVDATSKLKTMVTRGEASANLDDLTIEIKIDGDKLIISDKGIGMDEEEIKKYLNQVAFSSAQEFLDKYKDDANIIGHFGLGFYSAFMVASRVEVLSKSHKEGSQAVKWSCDGSPNYSLEYIDKETQGTDLILHLADDSKDFAQETTINKILKKYCSYLPFPIKFGTKTETSFEGEGDAQQEIKTEVDNIINNTNPIWKKTPTSLTDADYTNFYNELHPYSQTPLFWIHLNIDYPFNLTGILYFPKISNNFETQKNKIALYSNQVFVTDNVSEIVPEFLTLLHGVIDSPDIPLNVSRSYLQSDANVKKITNHITRKVADKLNELFNDNREEFNNKWQEINVFVKYGMISEEKFYDKATKFALVEGTDNKFFTLDEYKEHITANQTNKFDKKVILYTNNVEEQYSFIKAAEERGYHVVKLNSVIDNHFIQHVEGKDDSITFMRVDSATIDKLIERDETNESVLSEQEQEAVKGIFTSISSGPSQVELKSLSPNDAPVSVVRPEFMRRMQEMNMMQSMGQSKMMDDFYTIIVNTNHPVIAQKLLGIQEDSEKNELAQYLMDIALLNQNLLKGEKLNNFLQKCITFVK